MAGLTAPLVHAPVVIDDDVHGYLEMRPSVHAHEDLLWRLGTGLFTLLAVSYSCSPLNVDGSHGAIYVLRDETEKKQLPDSLREMAFHDTLT
ncbi:MAG: hypothetical protein ACK4UX_05400 [Thiobacillus sp.]